MPTALLALALSASLSGPGAPEKAHVSPEILVFAAASLTESLRALASAWEKKTGQKATFSFGASSDLARQIEAGAPADVFFSADVAKMDGLERAGLVRAADRREFLSNRLVVIAATSARLQLASPLDLLAVPKIALADPSSVPAGIYARRWLTELGLWEKLEPRVIPTLDVRAALAAVESESVPVGIVYRTDAAIGKDVRIAYEVRDGPEILYSVAALARSKSPAAAEAFVRFLAGDSGRAEFGRRGFLLLEAK